MSKELCRVSIDERNYQQWLSEDENYDELLLNEQEAQYDSDKADD